MAESASLNEVAIRSRLILEIASELVAGKDRSIRVAEVSLRDLGSEQPLQLSSLSTIGAVFDANTVVLRAACYFVAHQLFRRASTQ